MVTGNPPSVISCSDSLIAMLLLLVGSVFSVSSTCWGTLGNKNPSMSVVKIEPGFSDGSVILITKSAGDSVPIAKSSRKWIWLTKKKKTEHE